MAKTPKRFKLQILPRYVQKNIMFMNGKPVKDVEVKKSVVLIDGKEYDPNTRVNVSMSLADATLVEL